MKSRYWFLLSLALFIAAAFFWNVGEKIRVSQPAASPKVSPASEKNTSIASPAPAPAVSSNPAKKLLAEPGTNSAPESATNEAALFPHRLKNTSQTIEQLVRNDRAVLLRNALIDTGAEGVEIPDELRSKGDPGSYIVQARGTIDATFRAALIEAKAEIISYVPNNAYLVRLAGGDAGKLARSKPVQSVLRYEPYYKLDTELLAAVMDKTPLEPEKMVRVGLFPGQRDSAVAAIKGKGRIVGEDPKSSPFGPMLIVASADLVQLANMPQVQEIEPFYEREIMNDLTRVRLGVSTNTVTDFNFLDLTGSNIWVNVNDTTIDNAHLDLSPRIFPAAGVGITDPVGHGTHVAGIIASSGVNGPGNSVTNVGSVAGAKFRGQAPSASILSQDIFAGLSDAELQIVAGETNYIQLGRQSPLISNNSWGYGTRTYDSAAASFDAAVRDALPGSIGSQPIAYVFAAGNSGSGPGTITSPGTAKNVISVGALENKRNITNDIIRPNANCVIVTNKEFLGSTDSSNQVASFSSRGNVGIGVEGQFGRLKPDVVAPGTFIVSTRSQQFDEASYYSPLHVDRRVSPGLVMDPLDTNQFRILIPDNPCNEGTTLSLDIDAIIRSAVPPNSSLLIYAGTAPNPSTTPANLVGANSVTIPRANLPLDDFLYYDIVNTNDVEVIYDLQTTLVLSNDFGNFFQVLSNLNGYLAPNYIFESGTSMSAPAISGMLALMQEFFEQRFQITNSPAMMKALLINGSRAVGSGYNKEATLNNAGWGLPDIRRILPTNSDAATWPVQLFDQKTNFALATGERHDRKVTMNDTNSPLRITLVWTDPPGNPAVGVKLVNDLDLVVTAVVTNGLDTNNQPIVSTNIYFGNNFPGGEFTQANALGTNGVSEFDSIRDTINNVENVYINGPLSAEYTVSVIAKRVNVNAVTAHTNSIVQDYALVIAAGTGTNAPFVVDTNSIFGITNTNAFVTIVTNTFNNPSEAVGGILLNQRVGANSPLINVNSNNLTDGTTNQWAFYVLENPAGFTNIAFLTFLPPNLSGAANTVPGSRRVVEADIDMYVSTDPTLTNLNPAAIAAADKSLGRGGEEVIVYTNRSDPVFYVGIKSEDQRASEFSFFAIASAAPFFNEENGIAVVRGLNVGADGVIPDGSPELPKGTTVLFIGPPKMKIGHVIVTNTMTHERLGDLIATLFNKENSVVLHNHSFPITPEFPNGQESGTFTGIYDDFGLDEGDTVVGGRQTDGPGSLWNFVGTDASPAWRMEVEDNALNATGRVEQVTLVLERAPETNDLTSGNGFTISGGVPPGRSVVIPFEVPANSTNMTISIAPKQGALDTVVRQGRFVPTRVPYVDKGTNIAPPGASLSVDTNDVPPLKPGRYVLRLFNDNAFFVDFTGRVEFLLDLTAASVQTYSGTGSGNIIDDAVTESIIYVDRDATVVSTEVSVRIDHPRVSDLVLHLVSPEGTRILLAENRGGFSTNGYGFSDLATNVFPSTSSGDANASTNVLGPTLPSGIVNVDYEFFGVPDQLRIYYDGVLIFDSGLISGSGRFSVPYGPGVDTNIVIIMNEGDNPDPSTAWNYTATVLSGNLVYATFSENTNLALVPIKFAIPPFATNIPALNTNFFMSSFFEAPTVAGSYSVPSIVDGWTVKTNSVNVTSNRVLAHRGTNFLAFEGGAIAAPDIIAGPILNPGNGHYYYLLASNTWTASEARAITLGGHLVTVNDAAEDNWIYTTFANYGGTPKALWTGLSDSTQEGTFTWISGQTSAYRNWVPGEPNSYDAGEDFVHIFSGDNQGRNSRWNDYNNLQGVIYTGFTIPLHGVVEADSIPSAGGITRMLPTTAGEFYTLKFAHRRSLPGAISSANVTLDGVFTNEFVGGPAWNTYTTSFVAPQTGTRLDIDGLSGGGSSAGEVVYVANNGNGLVRGYTVNGVDLGNITTTPAPLAQGIAIDAAKNIYVVSVNGDYIRKYSPSGADLGIFASTGISDPRSMVFDANGNLYVANAGTDNPINSVRKFSPTGVDLGDFISNNIQNATGMAFDESGNLYVANYFAAEVRKFAPDGTYLGVAISAGLTQPVGLAVIPQSQGGGFYVANDFASTVFRYDANGNIVDTLTSGSLGRLHYLALDSAGNVYVSRFTANRIRKFSPTGQDLGDFAITGINNPGGIIVSQDSVPAMWFDTFQLSEGGDPNYFLPEESLKTLIGENAKGDWKLEIWDNRAGAPFGPANLLSWQLHLTFASTNATATVVTNATQVTNTVAGAEIKYFIVDVPIFASRATNVLVSGGGGLNLLFNQDQLPIGNQSLGDVMLLSSTVNGTSVLTTSSFPDLRPGGRYYLGVQNANPAQTNFFTLTVTFDDTNNLVSVTPLTNATPYAEVLPLNTDIHYYQYDLSNAVTSIEFRLFNLTADADLIVRRDQLPTESVFDFLSNAGSTNQEVITVNAPAAGRYYLGVYGFFPTNDIGYTIMVTENAAPLAPTLSGQATISPSGFHVTANTIIGRQYAFDVSLDLLSWTTISTTTASANITTFTDPTPPATQAARYYRLRMLP